MTIDRWLACLSLGVFCFVFCSVGCNGSTTGTGTAGTGGAAGSTGGGGSGGVVGAGGSAGTGGAAGSTDGGGAGKAGTAYPCEGGIVTAGTGGGAGSSGGDAGGNGGAGEPVMCVVGQSYCNVQSLQKQAGAFPIHTCIDLTEGLAACASNPTCACICGRGVICRTECSCSDTGGFVTVSCSQI
jgi:hypothetical protein